MTSITPSITSSIGSSISDSFGNSLAPIDAIAHFNETSIVGSTPVTAWNNIGTGGSDFDLNVPLGTVSNLTRIQSNGLDVVNSSDSAGLETTAGQTINTPMTIFMVAKVNVLDNTLQFFNGARSVGSASPNFFVTTGNQFRFNAGSNIGPGNANTDIHLHTIRYNADPSTSYEVDGIGTAIGDAGNRVLDFGTIFANTDGIANLKGFIAEYIIYPRQLSDFEVNNVQSYLTNKWNL